MDNFKKFQPRYENDIIQKEELLKICDVVTVSSIKLYKEIESIILIILRKKFYHNNGWILKI